MKTWKHNGEIWEACGALPLADRGFRYGMSVFETIAVRDGRPLLLKPHLERLDRAANDFGATLPHLPQFDFSGLGTGLLRFYLTAGPGVPETPFAGHAFALFDPAEVDWKMPPLRVALSSAPYMPRPGGWKTGNYWQNIDALAAARRTGCGEALLFNPAGMLVSASMANVFLRIDGTWTTPALATGARDGVVREWTLAMLDASESIHGPDALACCTSAFLTNSRMGIRTIAELDGRPLIDASAEIQQRYFDEVFST